jgi:hypothetical protein
MVQPDSRWSTTTAIVVALIITVSLALLCAVAAMGWAAYNRQTKQVDKLRTEYEQIKHDHMVIGEHFVEQTSKLNTAMKAMDGAYQRGFSSGRKSSTLPSPFDVLWPSVRAGYIVPLSVPSQLRGRHPAVSQTADGYTVRWRGLALFASDSDTVSDWTSKAWPGTARDVRAGTRSVIRMVGPYGTVYAWREANKTYAVVAMPRSDALAVPLVRVLG